MKRNLLLSLLVVVALFFTGCFETTEEITVNADGTGSYNMNMDMSGLFQFFDAMSSMDTSAASSKKKKEKMDTTITMRTFTDTAANLTVAQKALLHDATMKMVMDEEAQQFKMNMAFPFKQLSDVEKIIALSHSTSGTNIMGKMVLPGEVAESNNAPAMPDLGSYFDMTLQPHLIERKLNKEKYKSLNGDMQQNGMGESAEMLGSVKMNTVIHLPVAAKKATGTGLILSADKKTVTISGTMEDLTKNPEKFSYRIEY